MTMQVAQLMTSPVVAIERSASIADAAKLMLGSRISGLPVVDADKRLVGVVTEGDFLRRGELGTTIKRPRWLEFVLSPDKLAGEYAHTYGRKVDEVMSGDVVTVSPGASLEDLVNLMTSHKIKRIPVVDEGKLIGIVARSDVMRAMLRALPDAEPGARDDERIRQDIAAELAKYPWANTIRTKVDHGVAELSGVIIEERARDAARVAAENIRGVTSVVDQMVWMEPMSGAYILPPSAQEE